MSHSRVPGLWSCLWLQPSFQLFSFLRDNGWWPLDSSMTQLGCCRHLGSKVVNERWVSVPIFLSPLFLSLSNKQIHKYIFLRKLSKLISKRFLINTNLKHSDSNNFLKCSEYPMDTDTCSDRTVLCYKDKINYHEHILFKLSCYCIFPFVILLLQLSSYVEENIYIGSLVDHDFCSIW